MEENRLLTLKEVAKYLNVEELTVRRLLYAGEIKGYKVGSRWRFKPEDIEDYLNRGSNK